MEEDYVDSDDMERVLEISRMEHNSSLTGSGEASSSSKKTVDQPSLVREHALKKQIAAVRNEIAEYDVELRKMQELRTLRAQDERDLLTQLHALQHGRRAGTSDTTGTGKAAGEIDYSVDWDWSKQMQVKMKNIFGINGFRLCQKSVCNANMDGADIVCVMPTGGGKSLTYQLPALLTPGVTLVISPLISLITDQILHLREAGVEAVMLTGSTPKEESRDIFSRLATHAAGRPDAGKEIKLIYVTPERIARSKTFMSLMGKLANAELLARIVIDEAHCVSQLGHDFRPDYKKLNVLRQLFPNVPIMALSATCPPNVLKDLVLTLRLPPVVDGTRAKTKHTLFFSAPLYRKNLHYAVLPKPASSDAAIQVMADYILEHHKDHSGIVYCLSKKDAGKVAEGLHSKSQGKVRTGVYHADVKDKEKHDLHRQWRKGTIKVVCATIAFGLGIDKGDVRFVLHHAPAKSLDGYYQESGRAGRDGKDADCILYYRPQDAARLSALICGEVEGQQKLHGMLSFAAELEQCRKVHFAKYFSTSSQLSIASWSTDETDAMARCGHCDNCTRAPETVDRKDMTTEAWQILKIAEAVQRDKGMLTLGMLADVARGSGGAAFDVRSGGRAAKGKEKKGVVDLDVVAHGKVELSKDDIEALIVRLILERYLVEEFHQTAYATNVYFTTGPNAFRYTRHSKENLGKAPKIEMCFRKPNRKSKRDGNALRQKQSASNNGSRNVKQLLSRKASGSDATKKRKRQSDDADVDGDDEGDVDCIVLDSDEDCVGLEGVKALFQEHQDEDEDDEDDGDDWQSVIQLRPPKRSRASNASCIAGNNNEEVEVLVLSSD